MTRPRALIACVLAVSVAAAPASAEDHQIGLPEFRDRLEGSWVGQMAGVAWAAVTEGGYVGRTIPDAEVPAWQPHQINAAFDQDDVYVEIPFLETMRRFGPNASWTRFGDAFRQTQFPLWVANYAARENLRNGIAAPNSGHPANNPWGDSIDWQIESNFAGLVAPGMVRAATDIAFRGGHVMNYGDGVYGGVAFAAMNARAYTANNLDEVIEAGRRAVPAGTLYREMIEDVIAWHAADADKTSWQDTWQKIEDKWSEGPHYWFASRSNGAYVFMGLLYGGGDFENSMRIAMQGGRDSDCNPSSVGGILGALYGSSALPEKWRSGLNRAGKWSYTDLSYDQTIDLSIDLARDIVRLRGGGVGGGGANEIWMIADEGEAPAPLVEQWSASNTSAPSLAADVLSVDGMTVRLRADASDPDGIGGYQWFFGDLSYSEVLPIAGEIEHSYSVPGVYEIIAYATDALGRTSWQGLRVLALPEGAMLGDVDFDGRITADDYRSIDEGFLTGLAGYGHGDFNADGVVNLDDYAVIDASFFAQASVLATLPEPAWGAGLLMAVALGRRRASRSKRG